jgi:hypothetical protein
MEELLNNETIMWGIMSFIVLCASQLLKLPIKALTKKLIKDENIRSRVNVILMLIPLGLGILCDWLFCTYYLGITFNIVEGVKIGGTAVTLYAGIEKIFKGKTSKETTETLKLVEDITKDGKVDKSDNEIVKHFIEEDLNKVGSNGTKTE